MKAYLETLKTVPLFRGLCDAEILAVLGCMQVSPHRYSKGAYILHTGQEEYRAGILLEGEAQIAMEDAAGNRHILAGVTPGQLFAEAYACAELPMLPVNVRALRDCTVAFMDVRRIAGSCDNACAFHARLMRNLLSILAQKNIQLNRNIRHLSRRTTREKLLSYLEEQALLCQSRRFAIPLDRQGLADLLCVDRSAMSAELSKLRAEGALDYCKNEFVLREVSGESM